MKTKDLNCSLLEYDAVYSGMFWRWKQQRSFEVLIPAYQPKECHTPENRNICPLLWRTFKCPKHKSPPYV